MTLKRYLPMLLWMGLIFFVSHQPNDTMPEYGVLDFVVNKGAHLVSYFILATLARRATGAWRSALAITIFFAISDEVHQLFVVGRNGRFYDVLIDTAGALLAWRRSLTSGRLLT